MLDTDVNAAALAEQQRGAGRGLASVAYVTVGTGIGGGLVTRGVTLKGALHPEIGHLPLRRRPDDRVPGVCRFHPDCAEGLISGPAIEQRLAGRTFDTAPDVRALVSHYLGQFCATVLLSWSPHRIVLGGGVMKNPGLLPDIEANMRRELNGYGALVGAVPPYLTLPELEHSGLEGALLQAAAAVRQQTLPGAAGRKAWPPPDPG